MKIDPKLVAQWWDDAQEQSCGVFYYIAQRAADHALEATKLTRIQKECLRIGEEIQRAASDLPDGWELEVFVEKGYGCVKLYPPDGDSIHFEDTADGISHCITGAIERAMKEKQ